MELIALDDFIFSDAGIPPAMLTNKSQYLGFGVDRRSGIRGSAFFGGSAEPATWHFVIKCPDAAANDAAMSVLAVARDQPLRLLVQRDRYGQDLVTAEGAVTSLTLANDLDLEVDFEASDSVWLSEDIKSFSRYISDPLDHRINIDVPGTVPTTGAFRLTSVAQRTTPTAQVGWRYRRRFRITNNSTSPMFRYPLRISLGDTTPLTPTKALVNGDDLRVWIGGLEHPRTLITWDTTNSYVWIILPACQANGGNVIVDIVYGNPNASTPIVLTYPDIPSFSLTSSTNTLWYYHVLIANADTYPNEFLWYVEGRNSTNSYLPSMIDMGVPGSWRSVRSFDSQSDRGTTMTRNYAGTIIRGIKNDQVNSSKESDTIDRWAPHDTFSLYNPLGVEKLRFAFNITQSGIKKTTKEVTTQLAVAAGAQPVSETTTVDVDVALTKNFTEVAVIHRDSASRPWQRALSRFQNTLETDVVAAADYATSNKKHVGVAMWPYFGFTLEEEDQTYALFEMTSDMEATIATSNLIISEIITETEIYEIATELRLGGGANAAPPYMSLLIGNARNESGAGVPHAAIAMTQGLQIDAETRTHTVWDAAFNVKQDTISTHTVRALVAHDELGSTVEYRESQWLPLAPARPLVTNGDFAVNIGSWEAGNVTASMTATRTYEAAIFGAQAGSLKVAITPNTALTGASAETIATRFFPVNGREQVQVAAWVRTSHADIRPLLQILWYQDDSDVPVSSSIEADWLTLVNVGYGRIFAARVPVGVTRYRVSCLVKTAANSAVGNAYFDDVTLNDADLYVIDVATGGLTVDVRVRGRVV